MKIGILGSGRVGYSMGRYLVGHQVEIVGYYDRHRERAEDAARFVGTASYLSMEDLVAASDTIFITTTDSEIANVWAKLRAMPIADKTMVHFSGSLSSDLFCDIAAIGACGVSLHPMIAFSDKYTSYEQLEGAFFTIEGETHAVDALTSLLTSLGNRVRQIDAAEKPLYHAAASVLSNQVVAVLDAGYQMLERCGFTEEEARAATASLVYGNVSHVMEKGCAEALTGPIERGDLTTVQKHLAAIAPEEMPLYRTLGLRLCEIAARKHPERDYEAMMHLITEAT